jgi:REP element-mobilizing transposase RayT
MGRRRRRETPDGVVHVTARGNRRQDIYTDAIDHRRFEAGVADACERFEVRCLAYCEMRNHYHLLLFGEQPELSRAMHRINGCYAQWFNRRHGLDGHLFQDRFHGAAVTSDVHLLLLFRYILMNPVRAGICAAPADWRWSSYRATVGLERAPAFLDVAWVLELFDPLPTRAPATFAAFVADDAEAVLRLVA